MQLLALNYMESVEYAGIHLQCNFRFNYISLIYKQLTYL